MSPLRTVKAMVARATSEWGSVDLLCANAGILRDKSFARWKYRLCKSAGRPFNGTFYCCKAVWDGMRERITVASSSPTSSRACSGNLARPIMRGENRNVGLMNVLAEEAARTTSR